MAALLTIPRALAVARAVGTHRVARPIETVLRPSKPVEPGRRVGARRVDIHQPRRAVTSPPLRRPIARAVLALALPPILPRVRIVAPEVNVWRREVRVFGSGKVGGRVGVDARAQLEPPDDGIHREDALRAVVLLGSARLQTVLLREARPRERRRAQVAFAPDDAAQLVDRSEEGATVIPKRAVVPDDLFFKVGVAHELVPVAVELVAHQPRRQRRVRRRRLHLHEQPLLRVVQIPLWRQRRLLGRAHLEHRHHRQSRLHRRVHEPRVARGRRERVQPDRIRAHVDEELDVT